MLTKDNFKSLLTYLNFEEKGDIFTKNFSQTDVFLKVDFKKKLLIYPEKEGLKINSKEVCTFHQNESFVVFECVHRLLEKGYKPKHIELEPRWTTGHGASGGKADILVYNQEGKQLLLIECKTAGNEFKKALKNTKEDGDQLFSYVHQIADTEFLCLYASDFDEKVEKIVLSQAIISHKDNPVILQQLAEKGISPKKMLSFQNAKDSKARYQVWKDTYKLEYTQAGIFEDNIQPYQIGKDKYTLEIDTKAVDSTAKKGKYHEFRTILRKHSIYRRENAFEVLINLFLSKIVDEEENPTDLKFYWKGIAYDNYFDFVDRLQSLYQKGMKKFLNEDITYISNEQIDEAFWTVKKSRKNSTKQTIKDYFREIKFFSSNSTFSFIDVHNEKLFNKNAKVLLEIVQMWQTLRLKTKGQNQFLGDMFEFFLDNSIKQSEGQFFTPLPICKFVVMSLPLEQKLQESSEPLKAIDYACGAGHFLNEYAYQITPLIEKYKNVEPQEYYKHILGVEKEDRLAKISKVSAFMYGQDQIQIKDQDALTDFPEMKLNHFDVLVANPPFAVRDFLTSIDDEQQRKKYELTEIVGLHSSTNNIQCFFIERAKQILAPNGVTGIIVPSSILSNSDNTHVATREIILKYFDLISIVELGSGTFGKTGTNTVVLFMRRKGQRPEPAEHYQNRVDDFFEGIQEADKDLSEYQDLYLIKKYCQHVELPYEEYKKFLNVDNLGLSAIAELLKTDIFKDYETDFNKSTEIKKLKKKKTTEKYTKEDKKAELERKFIDYLQKIEKDKLYYFILAYETDQKVLLVKSPSDNKAQKQFLGYEWSGAKGSEGIKYYGGEIVNEIQTPMFDPQNPNNTEKINYAIKQNFTENPLKELPEHCQYAHAYELLDFTRKDFDKAFSLTPKNMKPIPTKCELIKLEDAFLEIKNGKTVKQTDDIGKYKVSRIESIALGFFDNEAIKWTNSKVKEGDFLQKGDILFSHINSVPHLGKTAIFNLDEEIIHGINLLRFRPNIDKILPFYAAELFKLDSFTSEIRNQAQKAINQASVNTTYLKQIKIPLPPKEIQQKIVAECEAIDHQTQAAEQEIEKARGEIEGKIKETSEKGYENKKLGEICEMQAGKFVSASKIKDFQEDDLYPCYGGNGLRGYTKTYTHEGTYPLIGRQGALCGNVKIATGKFHATEHAVVVTPNDNINVYWLYNQLIALNLNQYAKGVAQPGLSVQNIKTVSTVVPPLEIQEKLVSEIEVLESKIKAAQEIIASASARKKEVMEKYL